MNKQRRHIVVGGSVATAAFAVGLPLLSAGQRAGGGKEFDLHIELSAMPGRIPVRPGRPTQVWRYRGKLLRGDPGAFTPSAGGWLGPIIRAHRGQRVRIDLINDLPESTIIHWHGLHVPEAMDGHPRFAIEPGERYVYEFTVLNRAGSYWFHPHPHGRTGKQVYYGLAGLFQVSDDEEDALGLPTGAQDISLVLQDRSFDDGNQLIYLSDRLDDAPSQSSVQGGMMGGRMGGMMGGAMMNRGGTRNGRMGVMGGMMASMMGMFGDEILVNGRPGATLNVTPRAYRLRLLNASNSRIYKLAWHDATPLTVIGTDGGLLEAPLHRNHVMLAPAERLDLWVDFSHWPAGTELTLRSLAFDSGMGGMMGNMMGGGGALADGAPFAVLSVRVQGGAQSAAQPLPQRLAQLPVADPGAAVNVGSAKVFDLTMGMMKWGINGRSFEMLETTALETVKLDTQEIWEFRNDGGGMMGMAHSMHVHGQQFRVLNRSYGSKGGSHPESAGFIDEGWKDTVVVMPGERVRILKRFADYTGLFLYHCHMLEHEDAGLMRNYRVVA
ncbi:MAG: multicopper oxidase domain-containing protein [Burkholderiaceae bacterium]